MRSRASPISSARSAESSADCTIASRVTARASMRSGRTRILVHQMRQQFLVERAPVGADAHRLAVLDRGLDDGAELAILFLLEADIAGIDAVLVERLGAGRMVGQELVADIVEVADDGHADAHRSSRSLMCGTAAAASLRSTVIRTISEPARASAATCCTVPSTSAVSVLVMDCTTIGAPPPTSTPPTSTATDRCRGCGPASVISCAPAPARFCEIGAGRVLCRTLRGKPGSNGRKMLHGSARLRPPRQRGRFTSTRPATTSADRQRRRPASTARPAPDAQPPPRTAA